MMRSKEGVLHYSVIGSVVLLTFAVIFASCDMFNGDFLEEGAKGAVSEDILADKQGGPDALLTSAYGALDGMGGAGALGGGADWAVAPDNWIFGIVAGGMAHKGSTQGDQGPILTIAQMQHDPSLGFFDDKWKAVFEGVNRANSVLEVLPKVEDMSDQEQRELAAHARFLRAHFYFDLKKNFNNVPWIDENTEDFKQPNRGPEAPDIWQKIEEDFEFAMDNLPETQAQISRANNWAAAAYLAKAHLYQEEWQEAKSLFDRVINEGVNSQGQSYALVSNYQDMFNPATENNSGTVFSIQQTAEDGSGTSTNSRQAYALNWPHRPSPFGCCGFFQPTLWLVNSFRTDANGLPILDPTSGQNVENDQGVASSDEFTLGTQTLDPRLEWTVGRRGVPYHDWGPHPGQRWIREQQSAGPFSPKKHVFRQADRDEFGNQNSWFSASAVNYPIIRFADVLLMAAEAEAELGNLGPARQYVNRVRQRASNPGGEVTNELNEEFALAVVNNEADMLATDPTSFDWVVREDRNSTFVFLGGDSGDISNWNEYELPDYEVDTYPSSAFSTQQEALERIRFERKLELGMEGHRFYDLVRWGIADERLNSFYSFETDNLVPSLQGASFTPDKNEYYPIPLRQIDLSTVGGESVLQQNPGY